MEIAELIEDRRELAVVKKPPATGLRDQASLLGTATVITLVPMIGGLITRSVYALLLGPVLFVLGYRKQFWKMVSRPKPRLHAVAARVRPKVEPLVGIAQVCDRTIASGALAVATTVATKDGVIVRAVDAVPFWLVLADRRVYVAGECWATGTTSEPASLAAVLDEFGLGPLGRMIRGRCRATRVMVRPGDRVAVIGTPREEQVPGMGGYRDALIEVMRGDHALIWIEQLGSVSQ